MLIRRHPTGLMLVSKIKYSLLLLSIRVLSTLFRLLPDRLLLELGSHVGWLVGCVSPRENQISIAQLRFVFPKGVPTTGAQTSDVSPNNFQRASSDVFRHVGEGAAELLIWQKFLASSSELEQRLSAPYPSASETPSILAWSDGVIEQILREGKGAVGLSGHLGCYEFCAAYLAQRGLNCAVIGRTPNYPALAKVLDELRKDYGVEVIWRDSSSAGRQIIRAIKEGKVVCALLDQDTNLQNGFSRFFGLEAASPIAPIDLALRYQVPVFTSLDLRIGRMQHYIETERISYDPADPDPAQNLLDAYNRRLEEHILRFPTQWIWWHRRWRRRPDVDYSLNPARLPSTKQYIDWLETLVITDPQ